MEYGIVVCTWIPRYLGKEDVGLGGGRWEEGDTGDTQAKGKNQ